MVTESVVAAGSRFTGVCSMALRCVSSFRLFDTHLVDLKFLYLLAFCLGFCDSPFCFSFDLFFGVNFAFLCSALHCLSENRSDLIAASRVAASAWTVTVPSTSN